MPSGVRSARLSKEAVSVCSVSTSPRRSRLSSSSGTPARRRGSQNNELRGGLSVKRLPRVSSGGGGGKRRQDKTTSDIRKMFQRMSEASTIVPRPAEHPVPTQSVSEVSGRPPDNEVSVLTSVTRVNSLCMYDTNNFCSYHGRMGQKRTLTKTLWKDRGGGKGYGWVKRRVNEFMCSDRKQPSDPELTQNLSSETPQEMAVEPFVGGEMY